jgi:hypothetical protein
VVNLGEDEVNPKELWDWIQNVCNDCPLDISEGLCINTMETNSKNDTDMLKWMREHHDSPIAGHPG